MKVALVCLLWLVSAYAGFVTHQLYKLREHPCSISAYLQERQSINDDIRADYEESLK